MTAFHPLRTRGQAVVCWDVRLFALGEVMKLAVALVSWAAFATAASAQVGYQRYGAATGLSAELPGPVENFDDWTEIAKGRVIQITSTQREKVDGETWPQFRAYYFLQAVVADQPYDVEAKLKEMQQVQSDAAVASELISSRPLKPSEMPLPGMRGVETVVRMQSFDDGGGQIETARNMFVGNKWLSVSVRHFASDTRWSADRFFKSVAWKP